MTDLLTVPDIMERVERGEVGVIDAAIKAMNLRKTKDYARGVPVPGVRQQKQMLRGDISKLHFVYFIECCNGYGSSGGIKVGKARQPEKRLKLLQTGCPFELTLLSAYPLETSSEAHLLEYYIHASCIETKIRGEWFLPTPRLSSFVARAMYPRFLDE